MNLLVGLEAKLLDGLTELLPLALYLLLQLLGSLGHGSLRLSLKLLDPLFLFLLLFEAAAHLLLLALDLFQRLSQLINALL